MTISERISEVFEATASALCRIYGRLDPGDDAGRALLDEVLRGMRKVAVVVRESSEGDAREKVRLVAEVDRLRRRIDLLLMAPMTAEEAEAAFAAIDSAECEPLSPARIEEMVRYATDPDNASPDRIIDNLIEAARASSDFNPAVLAQAEAWSKARTCL